ncbi:hypothetical protein BsWGS_04511 [Bradybaena similaris]
MSVYLDGTTLSALLFSHLNSNGCQYGFLTGEKIEQVEGRISDSQIHAYDVSSYIYISSFVPWPNNQEALYSRGGYIKEEWIKSFLKGTDQKLIGWYSFRHNTAARPSLREVTLHNNLATSEICGGQPNDFLFFLCTSSMSADMSTHTYSHGFMHVIDGHFSNIPMAVMNLGDTTTKDYRNRSNTAVSHSKAVTESLHGFQRHFVKPSGEMDQITKMNHLAVSINKSLSSVHSKVFESEAALGLLETDVDLLRQRLELFEHQESKRMQIEAGTKRQEEKTQSQQVATSEKEQLETLFNNLGISSDENYANACSNMPSMYHTASFPLESCYVGEDFDSFQIIDRTPTLCVEHCEGTSIDMNTYSVVNNVPSPKVFNYSDTEHGYAVGNVEMNVYDSKQPQTVKDKVEKAFSFLNDEWKFQKETSPQIQRKLSPTSSPQRLRNISPTTVRSADVARVQGDIGSKTLVSDSHEFGKHVEKPHQYSRHVGAVHDFSQNMETPSLLGSGNNGRNILTDNALQTV